VGDSDFDGEMISGAQSTFSAQTSTETIKVKPPKGFPTAEFMLEHGFVDMIVHRQDLRSEIARVIDYCQK